MDTLPSLSNLGLVCLSALLAVLLWLWKMAAPIFLRDIL